MDIFFQNPVYVVLGGFLLLVIIFYFWTQTRFSWLLYVMGTVLLAAIGLIVLERLIVTDEEAIKQTLAELSGNVERNDIEGSLAFFSPSMIDVQTRARNEMPSYHFQSCRITQYKEIADIGSSDQKLVTFNVYVDVTAPSFHNFKGKTLREVTLTLERDESGEWKIVDYAHRMPIRRRE